MTEIGYVAGASASVRASTFDTALQTLFVAGRFSSIGARPSVGDSGINSTNVASWRAQLSVWDRRSNCACVLLRPCFAASAKPQWALTSSNVAGNGLVSNMVVNGSVLYVVGSFGVLNGVQTGAVGMLDVASGVWNPVPPSSNPATAINSLSGAYSVSTYGDQVIVGGTPSLATAGGTPLKGLAITGISPGSLWSSLACS